MLNSEVIGNGDDCTISICLKNCDSIILYTNCIQMREEMNCLLLTLGIYDSNNSTLTDSDSLYGFIAGILASNTDITDVFVDSALKIAGNNVDAFEKILPKLENIAKDVNLVMTLSIAVEDCPASIKAYV